MVLGRGDVIASKYMITQKLGEGSYGKVYAAVDECNQKYAVKLEKSKRGELQKEKTVYEDISWDMFGNRAIGVPRMYYFGEIAQQNLLVMDMLGTSLEDKARKTGGKFSLKTCLMIAVQLISRIQHMHNCGYLHRDIKPDNILTGRPGHSQRRIYVVDYGLAKSFRDSETGLHLEYGTSSSFAGTTRYASMNIMRGARASRRDDLESLAYSLIELRNGSLPWRGIKGVDFNERARAVLEIKQDLSVQDLTDGFPGMYSYLRYVRRLRYADRPKYSYLKECFTKAMHDYRITEDGNFDWVQRY